jgi:hypothetical protein
MPRIPNPITIRILMGRLRLSHHAFGLHSSAKVLCRLHGNVWLAFDYRRGVYSHMTERGFLSITWCRTGSKVVGHNYSRTSI